MTCHSDSERAFWRKIDRDAVAATAHPTGIMTAHADITRVTLTCPGFEGREATIVGPYRAPGALPGEFVVLLDGDFPGKTMAVQPRDVRGPVDVVTCGACERSWNDAVSTSLTPAPSGRCPFRVRARGGLTCCL